MRRLIYDILRFFTERKDDKKLIEKMDKFKTNRDV